MLLEAMRSTEWVWFLSSDLDILVEPSADQPATEAQKFEVVVDMDKHKESVRALGKGHTDSLTC